MKVPCRRRRPANSLNHRSTRFNQLDLVGMNCRCHRALSGTATTLVESVVHHGLHRSRRQPRLRAPARRDLADAVDPTLGETSPPRPHRIVRGVTAPADLVGSPRHRRQTAAPRPGPPCDAARTSSAPSSSAAPAGPSVMGNGSANTKPALLEVSRAFSIAEHLVSPNQGVTLLRLRIRLANMRAARHFDNPDGGPSLVSDRGVAEPRSALGLRPGRRDASCATAATMLMGAGAPTAERLRGGANGLGGWRRRAPH